MASGSMMALRAHTRGGPEVLVYESAPQVTPGIDEVLVAVHAAAITFAELTWPETWTSGGVDRTPVIPSHEFSGVATEVGDSVTGLSAGDEVYGLVPFDRDGAAAEYVSVPATNVALRASQGVARRCRGRRAPGTDRLGSPGRPCERSTRPARAGARRRRRCRVLRHPAGGGAGGQGHGHGARSRRGARPRSWRRTRDHQRTGVARRGEGCLRRRDRRRRSGRHRTPSSRHSVLAGA